MYTQIQMVILYKKKTVLNSVLKLVDIKKIKRESN